MTDNSTSMSTDHDGVVAKIVERSLRKAVRSQSGVAEDYVGKLREKHPTETPAQIRQRLDNRFLAVATASGTAVGAVGAVPGVGTVMAMGAATVESAAFLEASAFYTIAVATVHGLDVASVEHEETLIMTILLGANGTSLLSGAVGSGGDSSGSLAGGVLSLPSVSDLRKKMVNKFVRKFFVRRAALFLGKLAPAGVGAAIGGWGNRRLGKVVVETTHSTFGAPPASWNAD